MGNLKYITVTSPDITFIVCYKSVSLSTKDNLLGHKSADSQVFNLLYSDCGHSRIIDFSDADWARSPLDR